MGRGNLKKRMSGAHKLPADADVDFVLHAPGRDYDVVDIFDLDEDELDALEAESAAPDDIDEDADTGIWEVPTRPRRAVPEAAADTPWWEAARQGVRAQPSFQEGVRRERPWWEAARMGLRAVDED